jgi:hypothetical protein
MRSMMCMRGRSVMARLLAILVLYAPRHFSFAERRFFHPGTFYVRAGEIGTPQVGTI